MRRLKMFKTDKTIQEKMQDFEQMVKWFEGEEFKLEEALEKYSEALSASKEIEAELKQLQNRIVKIEEDFTA